MWYRYGIDRTNAPQELGGFFVAILILSPEAMTAVRAALGNQLQRTVNIALGSATSTIGMTIPVALFIAFVTKKEIELGLDQLQIVVRMQPAFSPRPSSSLRPAGFLAPGAGLDIDHVLAHVWHGDD